MPGVTLDEIQQKLQSLAGKVFEAWGMDLVELKVLGHKNDVHIQITADKPSGGINIRECAILNKALVSAIEQENLLPPECFSLELSSPGLDRPLVTRKDFLRVVDQEIYFWLDEPVGGKKEVQGTLREAGESALRIDVSDRIKLVLPLTSVIKGVLVI
jgi:ribosome maturation factor RimP